MRMTPLTLRTLAVTSLTAALVFAGPAADSPRAAQAQARDTLSLHAGHRQGRSHAHGQPPPDPGTPRQLYAIGAEPPMPGVLAGAEGLAVTADGHVIVADRLGGRLQRFTDKGELIDVWATQGTAAGQLSSPTGLAVLPDGDVLVVEAGTARVSRFSGSGAFEQAVDLSRRCPRDVGCELSAVAAAADAIYVGTVNGPYGILRLGPTLAVTGAFAPPGVGEGQVFGVQGLAVGPGSVLFASDYANNRIQRFGPAGEPLGAFGRTGSGAGQLLGPRGLAITGDLLVVADEANHRVHVFGLDGSPKGTWGLPGNEPGQLLRPADVAVRGDGTTFVLDAGNARIQAVEAGTAGAVWGSLPEPTWSPRGLAWSEGLGIVAAGHRSGSDPAAPGSALVRVFTSAGQLALETADPSGAIQEPVAVSPWRGGFAVADPVAGAVAAFGPDGRPARPPASDPMTPSGLVEATAGGGADSVALWVSESVAGRVRGFDIEGDAVRPLADGRLAWPMGLSLGAPGDEAAESSVLVADRDANRIVALDPETGTTRTSWGPEDPPVVGPVSAVQFGGGLAYADAAGVHWTAHSTDPGAADGVISLTSRGEHDGILDPGELAVADDRLFAADPVRGRILAFGTWPEDRWRLRIWRNPWRSGPPEVARWAEAPAVPDRPGWPASVPPEQASVTLEGELNLAPGWYSVVVEAAGPVRLWVGDRLVMQGAADKATLRLAGQPLPVRLDYEPDRLVALGLRWEPLPPRVTLWLPRALQTVHGQP